MTTIVPAPGWIRLTRTEMDQRTERQLASGLVAVQDVIDDDDPEVYRGVVESCNLGQLEDDESKLADLLSGIRMGSVLYYRHPVRLRGADMVLARPNHILGWEAQ